MASSFFVKSLDPAHVRVMDVLCKRFNTTAHSRALSRLLDNYVKDMERLRVVTEQRDALVRYAVQRQDGLAEADTAAKRAERADADLRALAKGIAKEARQYRIDL